MTFGSFLFYCIALAVAAYSALTCYPDPLFDNTYKAGNISVHSRVPIPEVSKDIFARVSEKLATGDFFDPGQKFEIYFTGEGSLYQLLAPLCSKDFACMNPATDKVFIYAPDFEKNLTNSPDGIEAPRRLESVLTHELTKAQVKHKLGALTYLTLDEMKKDGYAEHVTQETSGMQPPDICVENKKLATLTSYLLQRLALELVQLETDMAYPSIIQSSKGDDSAAKRIRKKYCS